MKLQPIQFCSEDERSDEKYEDKIRSWIEIRKTFLGWENSICKRICDYAEARIRKIDTEYFKPRIIAVCPSMDIERVSSMSRYDRHFYIFDTLRRNRTRLMHELPTRVLAMLE